MSNSCRSVRVVGLLSAGLLSMGSALAWADDGSIVLDLVRHGESTANSAGIIDTAPPGAASRRDRHDRGEHRRQLDLRRVRNNIAGVFASEEVRTVETAAPLARSARYRARRRSRRWPGSTRFPAGAFEGSRPTASRASCICWARCRGRSACPSSRTSVTPASTASPSTRVSAAPFRRIYEGTASATGTADDVAFSSEARSRSGR